MSFELKSFIAGKSDYDDKGVAGSFKYGKNLNIRSGLDALQCQQALVEVGAGVLADMPLWFVNCDDGNTYAFGDLGNIYKITSAGVVTKVYTDAGGKITGAAQWFDATNTYLYWATTNGYLHRINITGAWATDVDAGADWPKTNLNTGVWNTMGQADGALQICNKNKLAMVGYDSSYTNEALLLRPEVTAKTLIDSGDQVLVFAGDGKRNSYIFPWEQQYLAYLSPLKIPTTVINAVVDAEVMLMNCGTGFMNFCNMTYRYKMPVLTMDGICNPGGVVEDDGLALFGVYGGSNSGIWSYGRKKKNGVMAYNLEHYIDATEIGGLCKIGGVVHVAYKKTVGAVTTYKIMKVDSANKAEATYISLDLILPEETVLGQIRLINDDIPTGCKIAAFYSLDRSGTYIQAKMTGDISEATAGKGIIFEIGSPATICDVKLVLTPSGNTTPVVHEIYVDY